MRVRLRNDIPDAVDVELAIHMPRPVWLYSARGRFDTGGALTLELLTAGDVDVVVQWNHRTGIPELRASSGEFTAERATYAHRLHMLVTLAAARVGADVKAMPDRQFIRTVVHGDGPHPEPLAHAVVTFAGGILTRTVLAWNSESRAVAALTAGTAGYTQITYTHPADAGRIVRITEAGIEIAANGRRYRAVPFRPGAEGYFAVAQIWLDTGTVSSVPAVLTEIAAS